MNNQHLLALLIKLKHGFPESNRIYILILLMKLLPVFILTHDWNIVSGYGISAIISNFTLGPILNRLNVRFLLGIIVILVLLLTIISVLLFFLSYIDYKKYNHLFPKQRVWLGYSSKITFYLHFFLSQYFYLILTENVLCDGVYDSSLSYPLIIGHEDAACHDFFIYIVIGVEFCLLLYFLFIAYLINILCFVPFFTSTIIIVSKLNSCQIELIIFPVIQAITQLEYHIPFSVMIYIKCFARGLYILFYCNHIFSYSRTFYSSYLANYILTFFYSMCFSSCIIEYIFLYDVQNNLLILQNETNIIILKLLMEIFSAWIIMIILAHYEAKMLAKFLSATSAMKSRHYEFFNKLFYVFFYMNRDMNTLRYLDKIVYDFSQSFLEHKKVNKCLKINGLQCFCEKYSIEDLHKQSAKFLNVARSTRTLFPKLLQQSFPAFYDFLEHHFAVTRDKYKGSNSILYGEYLLISSIFYQLFDCNYNRSSLLLEEFMKTSVYKKSSVVKLQMRLIKISMRKKYRTDVLERQKRNILVSSYYTVPPVLEMNKAYKSLKRAIYVEKYLEETLTCYLDLLNKFNDIDITFEGFYGYIVALQNRLEINDKIISCSEWNNPNICLKLLIYRQFFKRKIPFAARNCLKDSSIYSNAVLLDEFGSMIFSASNDHEELRFLIDYASDSLCNMLGYTKDEIQHKDFHNMCLKNFAKPYHFLFLRKIRKGKLQLTIRELCILDKDNFAQLFNLIGTVIFTDDKMKIFAKLQWVQTHMKTNSYDISQKAKSKKKTFATGQCFIITNKNGKILSISKEFEKYFLLNLKIIKKLKISIFKDILKSENIQHKDRIKKNLTDVYDNIADIIMSQMYESTNDELSQTYKILKEVEKRIKTMNKNVDVVCNFEENSLRRDDTNMKYYFFVVFSIEIENHVYTPGHSIVGSILRSTENILEENADGKTDTSSENFSPQKKQWALCEDISDIVKKIHLIRALSVKMLDVMYNIQVNSLFPEEDMGPNAEVSEPTSSPLVLQYPKIEITEESGSKSPYAGHTMQVPMQKRRYSTIGVLLKKKSKMKSDIGNRIRIQMTIWSVCLLMFLIGIQMISYYKHILYNTGYNNYEAHFTLSVSRNIMISIVSTALYMQLQVNRMQEEVIDNGFNNSYAYHRENLRNYIQDYLNYFKIFHGNYAKIISEDCFRPIDILFNTEYTYTQLGLDTNAQSNPSSLWESMYYFHLTASHLLKGDIGALTFNKTIENIDIKVQRYKDKVNSQNIPCNEEGEEASVLLIENYFTNMKYPLDEISHMFIELHVNHSENSRMVILSLNGGISVLLLILFIIQWLMNNKIQNVVFAKYYLNFNYLRYMNTLLIKKTYLVKDFIDNGTLRKLEILRETKVGIINQQEENFNLAHKADNLDKASSLIMKSFNVRIKKSGTVNKIQRIPLGVESGHLLFPSKVYSCHSPQLDISSPHSNVNLSTKSNNDIIISNIARHDEIHPKTKFTANEVYDPETSKTKSNARLKCENLLSKGKTNIMNSIQNTTSLNTTSGNFLRTEMESVGKKQMMQPKSFKKNLLIFLIVSIFIFILSLVNFILTTYAFNVLIQLGSVSKLLYERISYMNELLLIYQICLLKNEDVEYTYASHGYLNFTDASSYLNSITHHNILEEAITGYEYYSAGVMNLTNGNMNTIFKNVIDYEKLIDSEMFCEYYSKFYMDNLQTFTFPILLSMKQATQQSLSDECTKIGKGFNKKGMVTALDSLYNSLLSSYKDFKGDSNRTQESIYKRLNDLHIHTYQVEMEVLMNKMFVNYIIASRNDYTFTSDWLHFYESLFHAFIIIFIFLLGVFYSWKFSFRIKMQDMIIDEIECIIYHTLLF